MNIYLLSQSDNTSYDTYDSCVVIAKSVEDAKLIHPSALQSEDSLYLDGTWARKNPYTGTWAFSLDAVVVELVGKALPSSKRGVVCASFNAG